MCNSTRGYSIALLLTLFTLPLFAQSTEAPGDTTRQNNPIPIPELAEELGNSELFLRNQLRPALLRSAVLSEVQASVDSLRRAADSLQKTSNYVWEQQVSSRISGSLAARWRRYWRQSQSDENRLQRYSTQLQNLRDELSKKKTIWDLTELSFSKDIPIEVRQRVDSLQLELYKADSALLRRSNELLSLQSSVLDQKLLHQYHLANMEGLEKLELQSMLSNRRQTLLELPVSTQSSAEQSYRQVALDYFKKEFNEFLRNNRDRMFLHLMLFLGIGLFFMLGNSFFKKDRKYNKQNEFNLATEIVFSKPLTTAFLITLLMTPLLYPNRPSVFSELIVMALVVPFVVIVPRFVIPNIRWSIYLVGALFFAHLMLKSAIANQVIFRWFILIESILLGLFVFSVGFRDRQWFREPLTSAVFARIMQFAAPIFLVVASMAALGNIAGYDTLAEVFNLSLEKTILTGLIIFSASMVIEGLLRFVLNLRPLEEGSTAAQDRGIFLSSSSKLLRIAGVLVWIGFALNALRLLGPLEYAFGQFWNTGYSFGAIRLTVGGVLGFTGIIVGAWLIGRLLKYLLEDEILERFKFEYGVPMAIGHLVHYFLVFLGFLLAAAYVGFDLQKLSLVIGALAIGLGFGLQNFAANILAGLILIFERPFRVGDIVIVNGEEGEILEIKLRSCTIRKIDGGILVVPNTDLVNKQVTSHSWSAGPRMHELPIRTNANSDPKRVMEMAKACSIREEAILTQPEPVVTFEGIEASGQQLFRIQFWTNQPGGQAKNSLSSRIYSTLKNEGLL
ncbi:mechanosensitive ion channel family protein [Haliscomenobacter hydrossis]|uniref:MscS Mechanosensitive ion channel n=1 Tax=Haliscomenobacter hydrossis (strain ATCC 27775 / DSM 1100 / LMG 10767 / O) TaxID=760192 RepID=F4KY50_HALH1|nr:mechanosensitive ion channel domain-containing protein [Haliscomenobacter hydrossis]AEE53675.1 MscS Mechanosensitive ion channel [Haliscomenobacter hydrossis DSM 1100]